MTTDTVLRALDEALPDAKIEGALRSILDQNKGPDGFVPVEINEQIVPVPFEARVEIVSKTFVKEVYPVAFSTGYRALVAIGGIVGGGAGAELKAMYCFATLFFNAEGQRFTVDFHPSAVWL